MNRFSSNKFLIQEQLEVVMKLLCEIGYDSLNMRVLEYDDKNKATRAIG